jgi:hypothetical protein
MASKGLGHNRVVEPLHVVGTQQPERDLGVHGDVEKGLVQLAFEHLLGTPTHPDRLADPAGGTPVPGVAGQELSPGGNDLRRIPAQSRHVHELHP